MDPLDWILLETRPLIKDPWLNLREEVYRLPAGQVIDRCYVLEYYNWVNIVALTPAKEIVLVRQFRHAVRRTILELPGGTMDEGEQSPVEAARRELLEETGYSASELIQTGIVSPNPATHTNSNYCFLALNAEKVAKQKLDENEHLELVLMPLEEAVRQAQQGAFLQALHVSSLFFALSHLGRIR